MDQKPKVLLGEDALYIDKYQPDLLNPIARSLSREKPSGSPLADFSGVDIWTAYELSWINARGKPVVAVGRFDFDASSVSIIESKSFKYYLNSLNQSVFDSEEQLQNTLSNDLSKACGGRVSVLLRPIDKAQDFFYLQEDGLQKDGLQKDGLQKGGLEGGATHGSGLPGKCIDELDISASVYQPNAELLTLCKSTSLVEGDRLYSHLLKSNCPVTGQPDWATLWVEYSGRKIDEEGLLKYVISYRQHQDFHENCVEQIFTDIKLHCKPEKLTVYARYTRRGGLDINPFRTDCNLPVPAFRVLRQ